MWTKWKRVAVRSVVFLIAVIAIHAIVTHQVRSLAQKSLFRVASVMVGTNFNYQRSAPWEEKVLNALSRSPLVGSHVDAWDASGPLSMSSYSGRTNMAVFTTSEQPSGSSVEPNGLIVFDSEGNTFFAAQGVSGTGSDDGKRSWEIQGWLLKGFPRRAQNLGLRLVRVGADRQTWQPMAELHIRNPLFARYPVWIPEPVPATKVDGDLNVTLVGLQTGVSRENPCPAAQANEIPFSRAIFQVRQAGRADSSWQPKGIEISDATGNRWSPFVALEFVKHRPESVELVFSGALWPGETAWKLRVELSRTTDFEAQELWTVRGIEVPQSSQRLLPENATTKQGTILSLVAFTGAEADQPGNFKWLMEKGEPRISVRAEPVPDGWRLSLVRVVDNLGREVETHNEQERGWSNGEKVFGLNLQPDATHVDCTFALHKSRFVEFLARPTFALAETTLPLAPKSALTTNRFPETEQRALPVSAS
jgi:hypothetical protein